MKFLILFLLAFSVSADEVDRDIYVWEQKMRIENMERRAVERDFRRKVRENARELDRELVVPCYEWQSRCE